MADRRSQSLQALRARAEAAEFRFKYGYECPVDYLAKKIADMFQARARGAAGAVVMSKPYGGKRGSLCAFTPRFSPAARASCACALTLFACAAAGQGCGSVAALLCAPHPPLNAE